jgi:plastocyanin
MNGRLGILGAGLVLGGVLLIGAGTIVSGGTGLAGMMGGDGGGMMGGYGNTGSTAPGPGEADFVAGTVAAPRIVRVVAGPGYSFSPSAISVARGETVTFEVTSMGGLVHEFMVGPADAVAADTEGTPEVADLGMMQTGAVTMTFDGSGPYAFACHVAGHYEAGMRGTITVVE